MLGYGIGSGPDGGGVGHRSIRSGAFNAALLMPDGKFTAAAMARSTFGLMVPRSEKPASQHCARSFLQPLEARVPQHAVLGQLGECNIGDHRRLDSDSGRPLQRL